MEQNLDFVERISVLERTVERNQIKSTSLRNRAGALNSGDFNFLAQIDATRKHIQMQVLAGLIEMDEALIWIDQLSAVRAGLVFGKEVNFLPLYCGKAFCSSDTESVQKS